MVCKLRQGGAVPHIRRRSLDQPAIRFAESFCSRTSKIISRYLEADRSSKILQKPNKFLTGLVTGVYYPGYRYPLNLRAFEVTQAFALL